MSDTAATPEVQLPDNFDAMSVEQFTKWRETGETPAAEEPKTESSDAPEEGAETQSESETDKQEKVGEPDPDDLTKKGLAKRFKQLTDRVKAAEARAAEFEALAKQGSRPAQEDAKPAADGEPKLENFETYDAYTRALARWEAKQLIESDRKE